MRSRLSFLLLVLLPLSLLIACSVASIDVSAEVTYTQMTPDEAYAFYGDRIACTYYNGSTYVNTYLVPSSSRRVYYRASVNSYGDDIPSWLGYSTTMQYVYYYALASDYSNNPSYLGVDIQPNVHFSDCTDFRFAAFAYCGNNNVPNVSAGYSDSFIYVNNLRFSNSENVSAAGWYPAIEMTRTGTSSSWYCLGVWADYHSDVVSNANLMRIGFNGARTDSGEIGIYLSLPQYNSNAVPGTGVITGTSPSTGTDINVTVDVDLDETNSLLGDIISGIGNIFDDIVGAISSVFIPDDGYIENWADDMLDVIQDAYSDDINADVLKDALLDLTTYGATTSLRFPGVDLTGCGIDFVIPAQAVDLKPLNDNNIYDAIATLIDILATIAVFNMVLNRIHAVFVGEKVVEIDGD